MASRSAQPGESAEARWSYPASRVQMDLPRTLGDSSRAAQTGFDPNMVDPDGRNGHIYRREAGQHAAGAGI